MFETLDSYVDRGLLNRKVSPEGDLVLYDYTEKCQWEKAWDEITLNHRGTVYSLETGEIVARSFPKFFNFSELSPEQQKVRLNSKNFSVYEKLDGSLGIIYYWKGQWRVNTRGSFNSDQAIKAKKLLANLEYDKLSRHFTHLVEIIYPENRIVVDYAGQEKLVLLRSIETRTGQEVPVLHRHVFTDVAMSYDFNSISEVIAKLKTLPFNEEGYVVQFEDGSRAKFKGDEYVEMHRLISGLSPLTIWERMENGRVPQEFLATIPEEFRSTYEEIAAKLEVNYIHLECDIGEIAYILEQTLGLQPGLPDDQRKKLGLHLKQNESPYNQYMFPKFLGQGLDSMIKKAIRPKANNL